MARDELWRQIEQKPTITFFDYYSVENDLLFIAGQNQFGASELGLRLYIKNNIIHGVEEFAGKIKRQQISYYLQGNHFYYPGIVNPVLTEYQKMADEKGFNSREEADAVGFSTIEKAFSEGSSNAAFLISPPSFGVDGFGDYGFVFAFVREGEEIVVNIHRFDHEDRCFSKSASLYQTLSQLTGKSYEESFFKNEKDFLKKPILFQSQDARTETKAILRRFGFGNDRQSDIFSATIESDQFIQSWIIDYQNLALSYSDINNQVLRSQIKTQMEQYLAAIYNRAVDIKHCLDAYNQTSVDKACKTRPVYDIQNMARMFDFYQQQKPVITGGGSCPVTKTQSSSIYKIMTSNSGVINYNSASIITEKSHFDCPACRQPIESGKGITTCPHCGMTASKWAEISGEKCT